MSDKKQAYLIMAHTNWNQLKLLFTQIDDVNNDIFLHINELVEAPSYEELRGVLKYSRLFLCDKRYPIFWGDSNGPKVQFELLKKAFSVDKYWYYHFISGMDLLLKTNKEITDFLNRNEYIQSTEHMTNYIEIQKCPKILEPRVKHYNFFKQHWGSSNKLELVLFRGANKLLRYIQYALKIDRTRKWDLELFQGSNWWSISDECARLYYSKQDDVNRMFDKWGFSVDEFSIQTIIGNSDLADTFYKPKAKGIRANMRLVDFDNGNGLGSPHVFTSIDYDAIVNSGCIFARKFDERIDNQIILMICNKQKCV